MNYMRLNYYFFIILLSNFNFLYYKVKQIAIYKVRYI